MLDVSGSMSDRDRKLAKTFFFWVVQGLRREYRSLETVFVAHTTEAWEFTEPEFFQVSGTGGTVASTGLQQGARDHRRALQPRALQHLSVLRLRRRQLGERRRRGARARSSAIAGDACFTGYVEVSSGLSRQLATETGRLFAELQPRGCAAGSYALNDFDDVWGAVRHFFTAESTGAGRRAARPRRRRRTAVSESWQRLHAAHRGAGGRSGLKFHPVDFEAVPDTFMMEIAVYGLPVRMPHWSFGVRYIYQLIQRHMGHSRLFEVVFPGNPGHAYLAASNGLAENILVTAHVLGHADFSRNNLLFRRCQEQVSEHIVEHAANHARQIQQAIETHGMQRVEAVLDAALALEQHIDVDQCRCAARAIPSTPRTRRRWSTTPSASASPRSSRPPPARAWRSRSARRFRRIRSAICCGSSRTTRRRWRAGSATSSSPCARSRSISTRCSPRRS